MDFQARYNINDVDDLPIWQTAQRLQSVPISKVERWKIQEHPKPPEEWRGWDDFRCVLMDNNRGWTACYRKSEVHTLIRISNHEIRLLVGGEDHQPVDQEIQYLRQVFPQLQSQEEEVPVEFVYGEQGMTVSRTRNIQAPAIDEILSNYGQSAQQELKRLTHPDFRPEMDGGKLLLWHGPPGAGKTYAVRALMRSWKSWCQSWCVLDAESFFGDVSYMTDLLIDHIDDGPGWRLLVIEDAGELMGVDAGMQAGQGLSRLLNLSDGILGQGLPVLILITTNQPLAQLHAAASRSGRCLSQQEFGLLEKAEAQQWLKARGMEHSLSAATSLADLYALLRGEEPGKNPGAGFGFLG